MSNAKKVLISQDYNFEANLKGVVLEPVELSLLSVNPLGGLVFDGAGASPTNKAYVGTGSGWKYLIDAGDIEGNADFTVNPDKLAPRSAIKSLIDTEITAQALSIEAGTQAYLEIVNNELRLKALGIASVTVDDTSADLTAAIAANYPNGNELQEGDVLIMTAPSGGTEVYMHNGGSSGGAGDFTLIDTPINDATIRGSLSAGVGLEYNPATGLMNLGGTHEDGEVYLYLPEAGNSSNSTNLELYQGGANLSITGDTGESADIFLSKQDMKMSLTGSGEASIRFYDFTGVNKGILVTNSISSDGMRYAADYSTNFTARSLVDKAYVDNALTSGVTTYNFENGLVESSGNVKLGGALNENTVINRNFGAGSNFELRMNSSGGGYGTDGFGFKSLVNGESSYDGFMGFSGFGIAKISSNDSSITLQDDIVFSKGPTQAFFRSNGFVYAADYSANFTARSLVDKAYVDDLISGTASGFSATLNGAQANGNTTGNLQRSADGLTFTITHSKGTANVVAQLRNATTNEVVDAGFIINGINTIQVAFEIAPSSGENYTVVVL